MKEIENRMNLLMGLSMSFVLTLTGMAVAGKLTLPGFLLGFLVSFLISLLVGKIIPVKKIAAQWMKKLDLKPTSFKAHLFEALVTDLAYSPLMTLVMVSIAHHQATKHGARIPFVPMLVKSELLSFAVAFVLGFVLPPFYMKLLLKDKE